MATASQRKKTLIVDAEKRPTINIRLVGKHYEVRAPKSSMLLGLAQTGSGEETDVNGTVEALENIVTAMFSKKDAAEVRARLNDATDDLDVTHIAKAANAVIEHFGADNPPT